MVIMLTKTRKFTQIYLWIINESWIEKILEIKIYIKLQVSLISIQYTMDLVSLILIQYTMD